MYLFLTHLELIIVASEARDPIWKNIRIPQYLIRLLIKIRGQILYKNQDFFFWFLANKTLNFSPIYLILGSLKAEVSELNTHMCKSCVSPIWVAKCLFKVERPMINFQESFFIWFLANKTINFSPIYIILGSLKAELSELNNHMCKSCVSPIRAV